MVSFIQKEKHMVYSYLRFSTARQEWGDTERRQSTLAQDWCKKNGQVLSDQSFADKGVSGWKGANRKGALGQLLKLLKPDDILLVEDNDRLSRENPLDALNLMREIIDKGVKIITLRDGLEITKNNFFALQNFLPSIIKASLAFEENEKKSMRIKQAWTARRNKITKGDVTGSTGSKVPPWLDKINDKLVINEEKATIIRRIFNMADTGIGIRSIASTLRKEGIKMQNATIDASYISHILHNVRFYGAIQMYEMNGKKRTPVGDIVENFLPAVITKDQFLAVQSKLKKRVKFVGRSGSTITNLVAGIPVCAKCGGHISRMATVGIYGYLGCANHKILGTCTPSQINAKFFETVLLDYIRKDNRLIQYFKPDTTITDNRLSEKQALLQEVSNKLQALVNMIEAGASPDIILPRLKEREMEQARLKVEIEALETEHIDQSNQSNLNDVVAEINRQIKAGQKKVRIMIDTQGNLVNEMLLDRLAIREAFRNSIQKMIIDLSEKKVIITWKGGAQSIIEMQFKRIGLGKVQYQYRSKTNGNPMSEWIDIGKL